MKTKLFRPALLPALLAGICAALPLPAAETAADLEAVATVRERGPHHERVELVTKTLGEAGEELTQTNSYVRLETGLHYLGDGGEWEPAEARFELIPGAAVAWRGQHKVTLAANLNTAHAVQQRLPDGQLLTGQVYGLAYHDLATGETVLIAEVQDSDGLLVTENQVLFPAAFAGVAADVRYTFTKAGFEQDVILREQPPSPADYGLDPATTRLEVWTEFTGSPEPVKRRDGRAAAAEAAEDETLDFGSARIGTGRTFRLGAEDEDLALVVKQWVTAEGDRKFLVEAVPVEAMTEALEQLPAGQGGARVGRPLPSRLQALNTLPVKADGRGRQTARMRRLEAGRDDVLLAQAARPGLVVDYLTLNTSQSNYTFTSDETYYVTGAVVLTGTTTFEGGTVVKLDSSTSAKLEVQGALSFGGAAYKPVVFTAKDDNTVGQNIAGSTGNPTTTHYGATLGTLVLNNGTATTLTHLRMNHLRRGLDYVNGTGHIVRHAQFVRCQEAVDPVNTVNLHNVLFHNLTRVLAGAAATVNCQHVTVNVAAAFNYNNAATVSYVNSLLVQVTTVGSYTGAAPDTAGSGSGIFQTVAGGNHYLVAGSPYRNTGSSSLDSTLAGDLKGLTTEAPQVLTGTLNLDTTLRPRVARDTDTPDKGYHYAPLDYVLKQVNLTVPLRLTNGVAAAVAGTYGVDLQSGSQFLSEGRAENLNRLTRWHNVQEQSAAEGNGGPMTKITGSYGSRPTLSVRFTEVTCLSKSGTSLLELSGSSTPFYSVTLEFCQVRNAGLPSLWPTDPYTETVTLQNNLFERSVLSINKSYFSLNTPLTLVARNNLFWRGSLSIAYDSGTSNPTWTVKDNLFDGTSQTLSGNLTASVSRSHNGFTTGTSYTYSGTSDKTGLSTDYQSNGAWGYRYYPATGSAPSLATLIDAGSQIYSVAGLTHFTVKTASGSKEGADSLTTVDIGHHYVGLTGGTPTDTDGDGLPDYVEDRDGDGVADGNETSWTVSNGVGAGSNVVLLFTPLLP